MGHVNFKNVSLIPETSAHFNRVSNVINRERSNFTFTSNGRREFVPRDQVSHLLVIYCSLFLHISCNFLSTRILLSSFYLLIFYFEKFSNWICCLPFAVYVELKLSNVHAVLLMQNIVMATVKFSLDNIEQKSCRPLRKKKISDQFQAFTWSKNNFNWWNSYIPRSRLGVPLFSLAHIQYSYSAH